MPNWKKVLVSGSNAALNSLNVTNGITGSLLGTSSYATQALTASNANTASYVLNAVSASFATSASFASTASSAQNASDILIYVKNSSGAQINKGRVVQITGAVGDNALIGTASYTSDNNSANTLGITNQNIANDSFGYVITEGTLIGIDTSTFTAGQLIYLGATGSIIGTAPLAPLHAVRLGQVLRSQLNNGSIYVRIDNGFELGELHDVLDNTTTGSYGDLLVKSGSIWINSNQLTGSYGLTGSLQATSFTGSLFGTASFASTASYVQNAQTASYVLQAVSASFATSASQAQNATSASFATTATTASFANNFTVAGTLTAQTIVVQTITSSIDFVTGSTRFGSLLANTHQFTGSVSITGSLAVNNSNVILTNQTSSMSVATASYVLNAVSSSFASTASFIQNAQTASYVLNAVSASFATTASYVLNAVSASFATTASYVLNAVSASFASTASFIPTSSLTNNFFVQGGNSFGAQAVLGTNDTQNLAFETNGSTRMFISSSGNVGIGTAAPGSLLQVGLGNSNTDALIRLGAGYTGDRTSRGGITWHDASQTTGKIYTEYDGTMVSMVFGSLYNSGYNSNNLMIIRGNGNVGIGTISPNAKLDVIGSANISGNTTITGSLIISQSLIINQNTSSLASGAQTISTNSTSSYTSAFYKYTLASGSNARAGQVMAVWNGANIQYNDVSTNDIGTTLNVALTASLSGGNVLLTTTLPSSGWTIKTQATFI